MQMPTVSNLIRDPGRNIVVDFIAYRTLSPDELRRHLSVFYSTTKVKKNKTYKVITTIGARD